MWTRRKIIGSGLAALGVPFIGKGEPVKSMLGANEPKEAESEWQNPYVTDGLIAMWDGIWNSGYEMHDTEATIWKDLAGSNDLDCSSNLTWGDNCAQISGDTCFGNDIYDVILCSIEFVWQDSLYDTTSNYISVGGGAGISSPWYGHTGNGSAAPSVAGMSNGCSNGQTNNKQNIHSYSFVRGQAPGNIGNQYWINGTRYENLYYYPSSYLQPISGVHMMANTGVMKSYCTRIYNRSLTAEEIGYNYQVDAERFGL